MRNAAPQRASVQQWLRQLGTAVTPERAVTGQVPLSRGRRIRQALPNSDCQVRKARPARWLHTAGHWSTHYRFVGEGWGNVKCGRQSLNKAYFFQDCRIECQRTLLVFAIKSNVLDLLLFLFWNRPWRHTKWWFSVVVPFMWHLWLTEASAPISYPGKAPFQERTFKCHCLGLMKMWKSIFS